MLEDEPLRGARRHDARSSRYIGMAVPRHAGPRRDHRRDRAGRQAIFPHGDDVLQAGDRVIIFTEARTRPGSSRRSELSPAAARIGRPRRLAIDVPAVAEPRRHARASTSGWLPSFPIPFALAYGEPVVPFLVAGAVTSGVGLALERAHGEARQEVSIREGFLVVALDWLLAAAFAGIPYLFEGGEQLSSPLDAYFEGMSGFTTTGASVVTDYRRRSTGVARDLAPVHAVARRHGDHRARDRGAPAPAGRWPPAHRVRAPGPGDRGAERAHPLDSAAARGSCTWR